MQVHQRRLAGASRPHDGDDLARCDVERDVGQRVGAPRVLEVHALEAHSAGRPSDRHRLERFPHDRLGVEDVKRHPKAHEVVLQGADRIADRLQRFVDGGDVGQHDEELAGRDCALDGMVRTDANYHGRADAGRRGHRQREERLTDGDVDAGVDRAGRFRPEALHLVVLALERRDHGQHAIRRRARWTGSRPPCP